LFAQHIYRFCTEIIPINVMLPLSFGTYRAPPNKCPTSAKYGRCLAIITAVDKIDIMRIGNLTTCLNG